MNSKNARLFVCLTALLSLSSGRCLAVTETGTLQSEILGVEIAWAVHLPSTYHIFNKDKIYPVFYGMHGSGGEDMHNLPVMHTAIEAGRPAILVHFMRQGGNTNRFFFEEFVPFIENRYRAGRTPGMRGIYGFSAGAGTTMSLVLEQPGFFSSAVVIAGGTGQDNVIAHLDNGGKLPPLYFLCGDGDTESRIQGVYSMSALLTQRGVFHRAAIEPGPHHWSFINAESEDFLIWMYQFIKEPGEETLWRDEYAIEDEYFADTEDFLGLVYIRHDPWIWSYDAESWFYLPAGNLNADGAWIWPVRE